MWVRSPPISREYGDIKANYWVEMHYKCLRTVYRLLKDMIILYAIHSCTVFDENSSNLSNPTRYYS